MSNDHRTEKHPRHDSEHPPVSTTGRDRPTGPPAHADYTLSRHEQMWITAQVNQPGWNLFYGIGLLVVAISLAVSIFSAPLTSGSTAIALGLSAVIAVGGLMLCRMGWRRIAPLQRLRRDRAPHTTRSVEVQGLLGSNALRLLHDDGREVSLRGPAPSTADGDRSEAPIPVGSTAQLSVFAPYDELGSAPARLLLADGDHAIGWITDDGAARF